MSDSVGILVAMAVECRSLTTRRIPEGGCLDLGDGCVVGFSGAGPLAAKRNAESLAAHGATALISWGCAAALADGMAPGDLVLPGHIIGTDGRRLDTDPAWRERLACLLTGKLTVHCGSLAESEHIVGKEAEKRAIHAATHAIALDMESAAAARAALGLGLPFLGIRSIVDPVKTTIPDSIQAAFDENGMLHVPRMLGRALLHPADFIDVIRLGRHFDAAMKTLKAVAVIARGTRFAAPNA